MQSRSTKQKYFSHALERGELDAHDIAEISFQASLAMCVQTVELAEQMKDEVDVEALIERTKKLSTQDLAALANAAYLELSCRSLKAKASAPSTAKVVQLATFRKSGK